MKTELLAYYNVKEDEQEAPLILLNDEVGQGEVHVADTFANLSSLQKADLLQDWIDKLEAMYQSVTSGTFLTDMGGESGGSLH